MTSCPFTRTLDRMDGLLRRTEVVDRLYVSMMTVRRLGKSGVLTEVRIGRAVRITAESVERLIRGGARHASDAA